MFRFINDIRTWGHQVSNRTLKMFLDLKEILDKSNQYTLKGTAGGMDAYGHMGNLMPSGLCDYRQVFKANITDRQSVRVGKLTARKAVCQATLPDEKGRRGIGKMKFVIDVFIVALSWEETFGPCRSHLSLTPHCPHRLSFNLSATRSVYTIACYPQILFAINAVSLSGFVVKGERL